MCERLRRGGAEAEGGGTEAEGAAGAERKTRTPHSDVGKNIDMPRWQTFRVFAVILSYQSLSSYKKQCLSVAVKVFKKHAACTKLTANRCAPHVKHASVRPKSIMEVLGYSAERVW